MKLFLKIFVPFFIFLIALEIILRIGAAALFQENRIETQDHTYPILVLGESTTFQTSDGNDWPSQLQKRLRETNYNATIYNEGIPATVTSAIMNRFPVYLKQYKPKLIITMMGINDNPPFWPKKFVLNDSNNFLTHIKVYKLFKYILAEFKEQRFKNEYWVTPDINYSRLNYPGFQNLIKSLNKSVYKSAEYNALLQKIEDFIKNKSNLEKAQFYSAVAYKLNNVIPEVDFNLHKQFDFFLQASRFDNRVNDTPNLAMHLAILTEQYQYCREIIESAKKSRIIMNETFLIRAAICLQGSKKEVDQLFVDAGDIYEFHPESREAPTVQNYLKMASYIEAENICWIAMEYPNRKFSPAIQAVMALNSKNIVPLSNYVVFQKALKTHSVTELFADSFAIDFGHATPLGNSLIANNVFELIEQLKKDSRCGL